MGRTVFIETNVIAEQLQSLPTNRFSFGLLCGQCTSLERDYIHFVVDVISSNQSNLDSLLDSPSSNKQLWAKIIELTSSLCAGVSIVGFYCRARADVLKSSNFILKIRRLFDILQSALRTYSPWSLAQSSHRILLQSELGSGGNKWLVKTIDMSTDAISFRPVEMKTYDSKTSTMWCITTAIPVQFTLTLSSITSNNDNDSKKIENEFEEQWRQYTDSLKESLLLMDDRLLPLESPVLPSKTSTSAVDVQWLSPIDASSSSSVSPNDERIYHKLDGSLSLRLYTCNSKTTGNDVRQYFIEDLFRSMLIRFNLALINNEETSTGNTKISKLVLPRRVYATQPVFISAYQLVHEPLSTVVESIQDNFKITSVSEDDLEAGEQFPLEVTKDEREKQFNSNMDSGGSDKTTRAINNNLFKHLIMSVKRFLGEGNMMLLVSIVTLLVVLISVMIKLF